VIRLGVNIDHVATLRQLRAGLVDYPNILEAARVAVENGADQITIHLRGDRRHIQEKDLFEIARARLAPLNLELAATKEMLKFALKARPDIVCLVPEKRQEVTTEGGLDVVKHYKKIQTCIKEFKKNGIKTSLFIEPSLNQIKASHELGADAVEFHTGKYALAKSLTQEKQLKRLSIAFEAAHGFKLAVHAGHGLDYRNTQNVAALPYLEEVNIGHSIVCRAVMVGLAQAVREMKNIVEKSR